MTAMSQQQWNGPYPQGPQGTQLPQPPPGTQFSQGSQPPQPPQSPQHGDGPRPQAPQQPPAANDDNPFRALFDFGFRRYATPGAVKIIYGLFFGIVSIAVLWLLIRVVAGQVSGHDGVLAILFIPAALLAALLVLMLLRVLLEFAAATVRMSRNTAELRDDLEDIKQELRNR